MYVLYRLVTAVQLTQLLIVQNIISARGSHETAGRWQLLRQHQQQKQEPPHGPAAGWVTEVLVPGVEPDLVLQTGAASPSPRTASW